MAIEQLPLFTAADFARQHITPELQERRKLLAGKLLAFSLELLETGAARRAFERLDPTLQHHLMPGQTLPSFTPTLYSARGDTAEAGIAFTRRGVKFPAVSPLVQYKGDGEWVPINPEAAADARLVLGQVGQLITSEYAGIDLHTMDIPGQPLALPPAAFTIPTFLERNA